MLCANELKDSALLTKIHYTRFPVTSS